MPEFTHSRSDQSNHGELYNRQLSLSSTITQLLKPSNEDTMLIWLSCVFHQFGAGRGILFGATNVGVGLGGGGGGADGNGPGLVGCGVGTPGGVRVVPGGVRVPP